MMVEEYERLSVCPQNWNNDRVFFYKYMSAETGKKVLEGRRLRWSTPGTLNDPYDIQFDLSVTLDREKAKSLSLDRMWSVFRGEIEAQSVMGKLLRYSSQKYPEMTRSEFDAEFRNVLDKGLDGAMAAVPKLHEDLRQHMVDCKILCLTVDPGMPQMWAYYAENHKGLVLRFRSIPFLDSCFGVAKPVTYTEHVPALLDEETLARIACGERGIDGRKLLDDLVYTKGSDWAHENEWRVFTGSGRDKEAPYEDIKFFDLELSAIILGMKMPHAEREEIVALAGRYSNVEILEAVKSPNSFRMAARAVG